MVNSQFIVFALVLVQCFIFCYGQSQRLYISSQGDDNWEGNSTYPLRTLQRAFDVVKDDASWEFCLIGNGTIDGNFEITKAMTLGSLTISACEDSPVTLEWNQKLSSDLDVSINKLIISGTVLETVGSFLFGPNEVYDLTLSNVVIDNRFSGSTFVIETQNVFSATHTNFWGPIHISVKIQLEIISSFVYGQLTLDTILGVPNSLLSVSNTTFTDIRDSLPYPAVDISGFPIIRFITTNFINNLAGVKITCENSLTISFENVLLINNIAIGSTYFILINPQGIDLSVKDSSLGCSRDPNQVEIPPFPSYLKSATITNSPVSCTAAPTIPGYYCDPSGPCTECQAGFYSDNNQCSKCDVGKISRFPGSISCESCEGNSVPNVAGTGCQACELQRADNFKCVDVPTIAPQTAKASDDTYKILLIVVNVVFFCIFVVVGACAYLASKSSRERQPLVQHR